MDTGIIVVIGLTIGAVIAWILIPGLSFSSVGGTSISSSDGQVSIKGSVVSVQYQNRVLWGDINSPKKGSNTISQSSDGCSIKISGGHVVITGTLKSLKVNGKKLA